MSFAGTPLSRPFKNSGCCVMLLQPSRVPMISFLPFPWSGKGNKRGPGNEVDCNRGVSPCHIGIFNHFTNIGQSLAQEIPCTDIDPLACVNPVDGVFSFQRINIQKVIKLLKAIDVSKATGLDKIPNRLLKLAADVVTTSFTGIFNQSLVTGIFPSDWKMAKVSPIFKNGSKSDLNNYRPISVIPTVAKIFEKIIYDQLYQYLNENGLYILLIEVFLMV